MAQFLKVKTVDEVLTILQQWTPLERETVELGDACGRILASGVQSPEPVPHFSRALMDGYAVRAQDTFGASENLPAFLEIAGEVSMGKAASTNLEPGKAIGIPTGGMLPAGADAVVMVEHTYLLDDRTIEVAKPAAPGDHVLSIGEDIQDGEELFSSGNRLRAQDIGLLAALGITEVEVYRQPRVAVISTGDEIVPVSMADLPPGKVRDINTFALAAQVQEWGGIVGLRSLVADDLEALVEACRTALADHDVILFSGGSSVGARDFTLRILDRFSNAELLVHGVAVRPGKPTILARIGPKMLWGLPGHPVSAIMICRAFVQPALALLQGRPYQHVLEETLVSTRRAVLSRQLPSVHGRTDYLPVMLSRSQDQWLATPVFGKSAMIGILARSDGYVVVPEHVEGLDRGTEVTVYLPVHR